MKWRAIKTVMSLIFLFLLAGGMVSSVDRKKEMRAESVAIEIAPSENGHHFLKEKELTEFLREGDETQFMRRSLQDLDIRNLEQYIEKEPLVANADVWLDANNTLHIKVKQREPMLRVVTGKNEQFYLDTDGEYMPLSPHHTARVMLVDGHVPNKNTLNEEEGQAFLDSLYRFASLMMAHPVLKAQAEQIHFKNNGEMWLVPKLGKHRFLLGKMDNLEAKVDKLRRYYEEIVPVAGWNKYRVVDLRYKDQIIGKRS